MKYSNHGNCTITNNSVLGEDFYCARIGTRKRRQASTTNASSTCLTRTCSWLGTTTTLLASILTTATTTALITTNSRHGVAFQHSRQQRDSATVAFTLFETNVATRKSLKLSARSNSASVAVPPPPPPQVQQLKPLMIPSAERRKNAAKALDRQQVERALNSVTSAHVLELLMSDQYLYPTTASSVAKQHSNINDHLTLTSKGAAVSVKLRPKGRPAFVPGAMNYETAQRYRQQQDAIQFVAETAVLNAKTVSTAEAQVIKPYISPSSSTFPANDFNVESHSWPKEISYGDNLKGMKPSSTVATTTATSVTTATTTLDSLPTISPAGNASTKVVKERKRVVKNLPIPRAKSKDSDNKKKVVPKNFNSMDLQKYFRTELLTAEQEYSLGMKIQFMMKCEDVHEGLASKLERLPTMVEWANACGFVENDPTFVATEADETLRPAGSENMFDDTDPSIFIGNGQAGSAGPGRGRGRVRKQITTALKDYYDDSELRVETKKPAVEETSSMHFTGGKKSQLKPINRGTPTKFVEMLMAAREAKQLMVQSNMRLVVSIARKYANVGVGLQDLVQEGSLGLSRAAEKFEPKKGFKFSTYASWWIQQAVFRSIAYHSRTIRLPVHVHNLLNRVRKVRSLLQQDLGRAPTNEEMAEKLGMTLPKYNKMLKLTRRSVSLEAPKYQSNPKDLGHESEDMIVDTIDSSSVQSDDNTPEKRVDRGLFHEDLREMLTILDEDERRVICARYGLADGLTRTVSIVAAQMKRSKAWVRSQECRALRKLRRPWYEKKLKEHQDALTC